MVFIDVSKKYFFWQELANEQGGVLKIKKNASNDIKRLVLQIPYNQYQIEFTETDAHPLKINCSLCAINKFEFSISFEFTFKKTTLF